MNHKLNRNNYRCCDRWFYIILPLGVDMVTTLWFCSTADDEDDATAAVITVVGGGNGGSGGGSSAGDHLAGSVAKFGLSLNFDGWSTAGAGSSSSVVDGRGGGDVSCSVFTTIFSVVTSPPSSILSFVVHSLSSPAVER